MKIKILLVILFSHVGLIAQEGLTCGLVDDSPVNTNVGYTASTDPNYLAIFPPVVYKIKFWALQPTDGNPAADPITQEQILETLALINIEYNKLNVFFKYNGFECYESDNYIVVCDINNTLFSEAEELGYYDPNSFNLYIPYTANCSGFTGYRETNLMVISTALTLGVPEHELAHDFYLYHTFRNYNKANCERVTRHPNDPEYNADDQGDMVTDTAAAPQWHQNIFNFFPLCEYFGDDLPPCMNAKCRTIDCGLDPYEIFVEDEKNFMTSGAAGCKEMFTFGQMIRMRETIGDSLDPFGHVETTIASLYEPYSGEYNNNGGPNSATLFQPGFDYSFVNCSCPNANQDCDFPIEWSDISFEYWGEGTIYDKYYTPYTNIEHPNHTAIRIDQIDDTQPRRCWDNFGFAPIGGTLITFKDNILNANVTIRHLDSLSINDKYFIDKLERGLYKIERYYNDGSIKEQVIFKQN
jgi:hypothetical protein